ncbi:MAG: His/Gly/Thr/Pro-type tRNA ligase C-terminal domain-containing protein [Synechococcus sp.]
MRTAELEKIPVIAVIGKREVEAGTLSIRTRMGGDLGSLSFSELVEKMQGAIAQRSLL